VKIDGNIATRRILQLKHTNMYAVVLFSFACTNITVFCPPEVSAKRKSGCERKPIV